MNLEYGEMSSQNWKCMQEKFEEREKLLPLGSPCALINS
jgi:hypothetical protein